MCFQANSESELELYCDHFPSIPVPTPHSLTVPSLNAAQPELR